MGPTGSSINIIGKAVVNICMGSVHIQKEVAVANLHDECLLGADILLGLKEGPFDFLLTENRLSWNGHSIPVVQVKPFESRKVMCASRCVVPGNSEVLLNAIVQRISNPSTGDSLLDCDIMVEPSADFGNCKRVVIASYRTNRRHPG